MVLGHVFPDFWHFWYRRSGYLATKRQHWQIMIDFLYLFKGPLRKKIQEIKNNLSQLSFCPEISGSTLPKVPKIRECMAQDHSRWLIFFSKILAKYFLRYRDFGDFFVLDYNMGPQDNILREISE